MRILNDFLEEIKQGYRNGREARAYESRKIKILEARNTAEADEQITWLRKYIAEYLKPKTLAERIGWMLCPISYFSRNYRAK